MLLPSPGAGERLRGERGGAQRVREDQRRYCRRRCRPGTVGPGGRAVLGAVGRDLAGWRPCGEAAGPGGVAVTVRGAGRGSGVLVAVSGH